MLDSSAVELEALDSETTLKAIRRELQNALPNMSADVFEVRAWMFVSVSVCVRARARVCLQD